MCWEMEVMDNGSAEDGEDEDGDVYARYVNVVMVCRPSAQLHRHTSIRLPHSEMALGFKGGHAGAQVRFRIPHVSWSPLRV